MRQASPGRTIIAVVVVLGCGPQADPGSDPASSSDGSVDESSESVGHSDGNGTSAADGTSEAESDDASPDDTEPFLVDCSTLPAGGPTVAPEPLSPTGFPVGFCNPRQGERGDGPYRCCSDDPAATEGMLPAYPSTSPEAEVGDPIFSASGNDIGVSGMCVDTSGVVPESGLSQADNCPIPCNPTWDADAVESVCGPARSCCQTRELQADDCVSDGAGGLRPATGADIFEELTDWSSAAHATHQDPNGIGCAEFAGCTPGDCAGNERYRDCLMQLSVADQRGFCLLLPAGASCPAAAPEYLDACERG